VDDDATIYVCDKKSEMTYLLNELKRITEDLNESGIPWCLAGGLALSVYAEPRTTKDVDVVAAVEEEAFINLRQFLLLRGYRSEQVLMHVEPVRKIGFRFVIPSTNEISIPLDILTLCCGIEHQIIASAHTLDFLPGVRLPVISLGHLLAMKVLSQNDYSRLQDKVDVLALLRNASKTDIRLAKDALTDISKTKFSSGKELLKDFELLLSAVPYE
jgi:hypothetical protein